MIKKPPNKSCYTHVIMQKKLTSQSNQRAGAPAGVVSALKYMPKNDVHQPTPLSVAPPPGAPAGPAGGPRGAPLSISFASSTDVSSHCFSFTGMAPSQVTWK